MNIAVHFACRADEGEQKNFNGYTGNNGLE